MVRGSRVGARMSRPCRPCAGVDRRRVLRLKFKLSPSQEVSTDLAYRLHMGRIADFLRRKYLPHWICGRTSELVPRQCNHPFIDELSDMEWCVFFSSVTCCGRDLCFVLLVTMELPASTMIEYKYIRKMDGEAIWESDPNNQIMAPASGNSRQEDIWR